LLYMYVGACCRVPGFMLGQFKFHPFFFIFLRQAGRAGRRAGPEVKTGTIPLDERANCEAHRALFKIFFPQQNFVLLHAHRIKS
jgi:hypothetical protein